MITAWCKLKVRFRVETLTKTFPQMIFITVLLGLIDFSDVVGQIVVANKTLSVLICLYYRQVCFHKKVAMTVKQI